MPASLFIDLLRDAAARRVTVDFWRRSSAFVDEGLPVLVGADSVVFIRPSRSGKKCRGVVVVALADLTRLEVTEHTSTLVLDEPLRPLLHGSVIDTVRALAGGDEVVALGLADDVIVVARVIAVDDDAMAVQVWGPRSAPRERVGAIRLRDVLTIELRSRYVRKLLESYASSTTIGAQR